MTPRLEVWVVEVWIVAVSIIVRRSAPTASGASNGNEGGPESIP
ncbi:hypothetical protein [Methylobacterium sp. BTF04]|nr:hypothetical protein [Methylobacterium sp. BTF04]